MPFPGGGGVSWFWSTYIHTHDRLDKPCSALADARLKTLTIHVSFAVIKLRLFHNAQAKRPPVMPLNMLEYQNTMFASGNITFLKILVVDWPWHTNGLSQMKISILIPIPHEIYTQRWKIDWSHLFLVSICVWDVMRSGPRTTQSASETPYDLVPGRRSWCLSILISRNVSIFSTVQSMCTP